MSMASMHCSKDSFYEEAEDEYRVKEGHVMTKDELWEEWVNAHYQTRGMVTFEGYCYLRQYFPH